MNDSLRTSESEEQCALFQWAEMMSRRYSELSLLYHIPNGGARSKGTAGRLKAEGVKSGVPDICLPVARGRFHGLYIEMKVGKNKPTANQIQWLEALEGQGYQAKVCYGWQEASHVIESYLKGADE